MATRTKRKPTKVKLIRLPMLGGHVSEELYAAVLCWVAQDPERSLAIFIREAARAKLRAEGICFSELRKANPFLP